MQEQYHLLSATVGEVYDVLDHGGKFMWAFDDISNGSPSFAPLLGNGFFNEQDLAVVASMNELHKLATRIRDSFDEDNQ